MTERAPAAGLRKGEVRAVSGVDDKVAGLSKLGVDMRLCSNAMRAAGCQAGAIHGFVTIVPAGHCFVRANQPTARSLSRLRNRNKARQAANIGQAAKNNRLGPSNGSRYCRYDDNVDTA